MERRSRWAQRGTPAVHPRPAVRHASASRLWEGICRYCPCGARVHRVAPNTIGSDSRRDGSSAYRRVGDGPHRGPAAAGKVERLVRERTAAFRKSEEHSRLLVEYAISSIAAHRIVLDEEGRAVDYVFLSANPAFEEQTGLRVADILGRRATEVIPGIEKTSLIQDYGSVVLTGVPISIERYIEPLGRHYHIHAYRLDEHCFATLFADITQRKQVETELRQTVAALEAAKIASLKDPSRLPNPLPVRRANSWPI